MKSRELIVGVLIGAVVTAAIFTLLAGQGIQQARAQAPDAQRRVVDMEITDSGSNTAVYRMWSDGTLERMFPYDAPNPSEWVSVQRQ